MADFGLIGLGKGNNHAWLAGQMGRKPTGRGKSGVGKDRCAPHRMSRLVLVVGASRGIGGCAVLAGAGLGGAGGFFVAGPPGGVAGAGAGAVGGTVGASVRR